MANLHDTLWEKLQSEPRPIDGERILALAKEALPSAQYRQFETWTKANGIELLRMLNG